MTPQQDSRQRRREEKRRAEKQASRSALATASVSNGLSIEESPTVKMMKTNRTTARLKDELAKRNSFENIFLDVLVGKKELRVDVWEDNHETQLRVLGSSDNEAFCRCELEWPPAALQEAKDIYMYSSVAVNTSITKQRASSWHRLWLTCVCCSVES